jgi:agmatine deiminase
VIAEMIRHLAPGEEVHVNVADDVMEGEARAVLAEAKVATTNVFFHHFPTNDAWCRDHGPIFVQREQGGAREQLILDWGYNAWGGKYPPFDLDNEIPRLVAEQYGIERVSPGMILEGGSIEVNGEGILLTTEACLLNPNRNPELNKAQIEQRLRDHLGVRKILWLGEGIVGDDTDGHIDDITRFYRPDGFITAVEPNRRDPNHRILEENLERLRGFRTPAGGKFELVTLPMPKPFAFEGQRVPASYANFLIINGAVLVPTFRQKRRDAEACAIIGGCFPGREVVPIDCYHLIWGLGTLHCISQQQPA